MVLASTKIAESVDNAFYWIGGISLVLLIGITVTMLVFAFKYSRKRHPKAAKITGSWKLEVTWIVIPTIIVFFMFWKGLEGFRIMRTEPEDPMIVEVEAMQWSWTFTYPEVDVSDSELYIPTGRPIKLLLTTPIDDVVHSFYVPDFRVKEDCVPGRVNWMWIEADVVGMHNIFCAEFCGKDHSKMNSRVHALTPEDFEAWLDKKVAQRYRPVEIDLVMDPTSQDIVDCGPEALYATYCASCHGKEGKGGLVGGARDFRDLEGWKRSPKVTDIFRTLTKGVAGTQMRAFDNLSAWDRFALAWYVAGFYKGTDRPKSERADYEKLVVDYKLDEQPDIRRRVPIAEAMEAIAEEAGATEEGDG